MNNFEKIFPTPLERSIAEIEIRKEIPEPEVKVERGEEVDFHNTLRKELKEKQKGGSDIHFGQIDLDKLSNPALDLYGKYKRRKGGLEESLAEFRKKTAEGSDDFNFAAMLLNWHMDYMSEKKLSEIKKRKATQLFKV